MSLSPPRPPFSLPEVHLPKGVDPIARAIEQEGGECYLVGGRVRDALLGIASKDLDIEVHRLSAERLEALLRRFGRPSRVGKAFGILLMRVGGVQVDFALPRREKKVGEGHRDFEVDTDPMMGFEAASARRDFTINSMGIRLPSMELCDPHGGRADLEQGVLRHVGPAFGEDPLRALRGAQFAARFELKIDPATLELCAEQNLAVLSPERIDEEFRKLLLKPKQPSIGLRAIREMRLLRFFPELDLPPELWDRTFHRCDGAAAERERLAREGVGEKELLLLMLLALTVDLTKEEAVRLLNRLTRDRKILDPFPNAHDRFRQLLALEPRCLSSESIPENRIGWVRRLVFDLAPPLAAALLAASVGAVDASDSPAPEAFRRLLKEGEVETELPTPWVQGRDLMELGMEPGPAMGKIVKELFERQLDRELQSREEALIAAKQRLAVQ